MQHFSAGDLLEVFDELAAILSRNGEHGRIYVAGGAAMILAAGADRTTKDIDASIDDGHGAVTRAAHTMARRRKWNSSWLNEQASAYMPPQDRRRGTVIFDHPALKVIAASKEHLLAMKVRAARATDRPDVEQLLASCGYDTVEKVEALVIDVFGDGLRDRNRLWLARILEGSQEQDSASPEGSHLT